MCIGDLVKLKGFDQTDQNDVPHGIISADLGLHKYKVKWLNEKIAKRWALPVIMSEEKLEILNSTKAPDS